MKKAVILGAFILILTFVFVKFGQPQTASAQTAPSCSTLAMTTRTNIISKTTVTVTAGQSVSLVANIINDNNVRNNSTWNATGGTYQSKNWDYATWIAPTTPGDYIITYALSGVNQSNCTATFRIPTPPGIKLAIDPIAKFGPANTPFTINLVMISDVAIGTGTVNVSFPPTLLADSDITFIPSPATKTSSIAFKTISGVRVISFTFAFGTAPSNSVKILAGSLRINPRNSGVIKLAYKDTVVKDKNNTIMTITSMLGGTYTILGPTSTPTPIKTPSPTFSPGRPSPCNGIGDVNDDKVVNEADVLLVLRYIAGLDNPTAEQLRRANVDGVDSNGNPASGIGSLNLSDVLSIRRYIAGLDNSTFPACNSTCKTGYNSFAGTSDGCPSNTYKIFNSVCYDRHEITIQLDTCVNYTTATARASAACEGRTSCSQTVTPAPSICDPDPTGTSFRKLDLQDLEVIRDELLGNLNTNKGSCLNNAPDNTPTSPTKLSALERMRDILLGKVNLNLAPPGQN